MKLADALFITLVTAEKYPFRLADIARGGRLIAISIKDLEDTFECKNCSVKKFDESIKSNIATVPITKLKKIDCFVIFFISAYYFKASFLDTK